MASYILKKIKAQLETIEVLQQKNKFAEIEVRFAEIKNYFSSNLGPEIFQKIYNKFNNEEGYHNEIIVDYIFNNKTKFDFLKNDDFNLRQSKFMKKITYKNQFEELTSDFNFENFNMDKNTNYNTIEYSVKEKKTQATKDNFRYSYSLEHDIDMSKRDNDEMLHSSNKPYENIRFKNRYSKKLNKYLRLDLTIVKKVSAVQLKETEDLEYIVEIEIMNIDNKKEMLMSLKQNMKTIRRLYFNKKQFIFNLATMNPATMEKKDLPFLKKYKYTVTDKADGERIFVIIFDGIIYFYNPKTQAIIYEAPNPTKITDTVIDGEYLEKTNEYLAFDLLMFNYKDKRDRFLTERLKVLEEITKNHFPLITKEGIADMKMKKFYTEDIFDNAKALWDERKERFHYQLDGLIFTPIEQPYTSDKQEIPVLKWKEALSIDVRVEYNHKQGFTYFHHGTKGLHSKPWGMKPHRNLLNDPKYFDEFEKDIQWLRWQTTKQDIIKNLGKLNLGKVTLDKKGRENFALGIHGVPQSNSMIRPIWSKYDIVEYEFDFELNQWVAIRKRTFDKEKANAYRTVESVIKSVINYISIDELYELKNQNVENIGALYDLTRDDIKRKQWRKYNNYVKGALFKEVSKIRTNKHNYHLELACGKGGDIHKLIKNGYKNILAIDSSKEEIYGKKGYEDRLEGMGFKKMGYYWEKNGVKFTVVWGDVTENIKNSDSGLSEEDKEKLKSFFDDLPENWEGFDTISIMYAIHYFFGEMEEDKEDKVWKADKGKWEGFMKNIKELLKYNGLVFGAYLNGDNMSEEKMDFVKDGDLMYRIEHLQNKRIPKTITYEKFFNKKKINTIEISNEVWGLNVQISEPKINKKILEISMDNYGLSSIKENNTFEQYYKDFTEETRKELSQDEKRLSFINNTFIFGYINIEQIKLKINDLLEINIYDTKEFVDYLKANIENGELDNKVKDLYNILVKN